MKIWTLSVHSESGDDYGTYTFNREPTEDEIEAMLRHFCPGEWPDDPDEEGPGFRNSMLHIKGPDPDEVIDLDEGPVPWLEDDSEEDDD